MAGKVVVSIKGHLRPAEERAIQKSAGQKVSFGRQNGNTTIQGHWRKKRALSKALEELGYTVA